MNPKNEVEAIITLPPGARPTEPGWYVVQKKLQPRQVVQMPSRGRVIFSYSQLSCDIEEVLDGGWNFIARIYPDRIGQE